MVKIGTIDDRQDYNKDREGCIFIHIYKNRPALAGIFMTHCEVRLQL